MTMRKQETSPAPHSGTSSRDVFGEDDATSITLSPDELSDVGELRSCRSDSARFAKTIERFVARALLQLPQYGEGYHSALNYFLALATVLETRHRFSPEHAVSLHDAMVNAWQRHVAGVVGKSLRSSDRLQTVLDDIIDNAELAHGADVPRVIRLALQTALNELAWQNPPITGSQVSAPQSHSESSGAAGNEHIEDNAREPDLEMGDADGGAPAATAEPATDNQARQDRFTSVEQFFWHHAVKAKKAALKGGWKKDADRKAAKRAARAKWGTLDMRTKSEWEELFERSKTDTTQLKLAATTHLFADGVAQSIRRPAPIANQSSNKTLPKQPNPPTPRLIAYRELKRPELVSFIAFQRSLPLVRAELTAACRAALVSNRQGSTSVANDGGDIQPDDGIFTIRWSDVKAARDFPGMTIVYRGHRRLAQPYPTAPPQIFVMHMNHQHNNAVQPDVIFNTIADAIPNVRFHLRHQEITKSTDTAWLIVFEHPLQLLRFTVGIRTPSGSYYTTQFEPVMRDAACAVCKGAHSTVECKLLLRAGKKELKIRESQSSARYLGKVPDVEA